MPADFSIAAILGDSLTNKQALELPEVSANKRERQTTDSPANHNLLKRQCQFGEEKEDSTNSFQFKPSNIINFSTEHYEIVEELGQGSFGQVFKCINSTSKLYVAIKVCNSAPHHMAAAENERNILLHLQKDAEEHNFVKFFESFYFGRRFCIVMECMDVNLGDFLQEQENALLHLNDVKIISKQIFCALKKLKDIGIVHADLKPENIMLLNRDRYPCRVKVIDFGISFGNQPSQSVVQTLQYRAPEVLLGFSYSHAIDMWSVGCIMAEMYLGCPLYDGENAYQQLSMITKSLTIPNGYHRKITKVLTKEFWSAYRPIPLKMAKVFEKNEIVVKTAKENLLVLTDNLRQFHSIERPENEVLHKDFITLLQSILVIDDRVRCTPDRALESLFIEDEIDVVN